MEQLLNMGEFQGASLGNPGALSTGGFFRDCGWGQRGAAEMRAGSILVHAGEKLKALPCLPYPGACAPRASVGHRGGHGTGIIAGDGKNRAFSRETPGAQVVSGPDQHITPRNTGVESWSCSMQIRWNKAVLPANGTN